MKNSDHSPTVIAHLASLLLLLLLSVTGIGISIRLYRTTPWTLLGALTVGVAWGLAIIGVAGGWEPWLAWVSGSARFLGRILLSREYGVEEPELSLLVKHNQALVRSVGEKSSQLGELRVELKSAKEKAWKSELDRIRSAINAGYSYSQREAIENLAATAEKEAAGVQADESLIAQIYRVAAIAFLPSSPGGDSQKAKRFLAKASKLANGEESIGIHIVRVLLTLDESGPTQAVALLQERNDEDSIRLSFSLLLELTRLEEAESFIKEGRIRAEWLHPGATWHAALATFYSIKGERIPALDHLEQFLQGEESADRHRISGGILLRAAYAERNRIIERYDLFPEFAIAVELDDLVEVELVERAADHFFRAGRLYEVNQCPVDAINAYESVAFTLLDLKIDNDVSRKALSRLRNLRPDSPAVLAAKYSKLEMAETPEEVMLAEIEGVFQRVDLPGHLKLSILEAYSNTYGRQHEASSILRARLSNFKSEPSSYTHAVLLLVKLLKELDDVDGATEIIDDFEKSTHKPHLPCILRGFLYHQVDDTISANIAGACLDKYPDHPEVLATAAISAGRAGKIELHVSAAQKLFEIVRSPQTIGMYISALWHSKQYATIAELLRSEKTEKLPELDRHRWLARALLATRSDIEAVDHLNWLRGHGFATLQELVALAQILLLVLDKPTEARNVLADAISRYPNHPEPYLLTSRLHILDGNRVQAFSWARKARDRFPDDANVAANLWILSFPTGYEDHQVTEAAWADISPGGRLYTGDFIRPAPFSQFLEWLEARSRVQTELEQAYYKGRLSLPLLCYFQGLQAFDVHKAALRAGQDRYVSKGDQPTANVVMGDEIVLELTALFSLWSLFKDRLIEELASSYTTVWIPASLRKLLINEQNEIVTGGQRARYESQVRVRDLIESAATKFIFHSFPDNGLQSPSQLLSELAEELGMVCLQEFSSPEDPLSSLSLGIADVLGILEREGLLTPDQVDKQSLGKRPPLDSASKEVANVSSSRRIVVDLTTLTELADSGIANLLVDYMQEIHVTESDRRILLSEIARFERRQLIQHELREIRSALRAGEERGILRFASAPLHERFLERDLEDRQFDTGILAEAVRVYTSYLDDLLWIIHDKGVALWSDDLWTRQLSTVQRKVERSFTTDAYLRYRAITDDGVAIQERSEYLSSLSELLTWGYQIIPMYPEFIRWRLGNPPGQVSASAKKELERFRAGLVNLFKRARENGGEAKGLAQEALGFYQDGIVRLMWDLFQREYGLQVCSDIFSELDLARHAEAAEGWEYAIYTSFYSHSIMTILAEGRRETGDEKISLFHSWAWDMFAASGVRREALEYAWLELLQRLLDLIKSATSAEEEKVGKALLGRHIVNIPYQAWDYLVRTDVGRRLERDFQVAKPGVVLRFEAATGTGAHPMVAAVDQQQWEADIQEAFDLWIADPNSKTVVHGSVAMYPRLVEMGIPFVQVELIPAEFLPEREILRGEFRTVGLLHGITSDNPNLRRFIWEQGLEAIVSAGQDTAEWHGFVEQGLFDDAAVAQEVGTEALDYLLGNLDICRKILSAATRLGSNSTIYVLRNLSPDAVGRWIDMPPLDSMSDDEWILDIKKWIPEKVAEAYLDSDESGLATAASLFDRYGRNILVGAKEFLGSLRSRITALGNIALREHPLDSILKSIGESNSRIYRTSGIAFLLHVLSDQTLQDNTNDRSSLITSVYHLLHELLEPADCDEEKTNIIALEQILANWFFERWKAGDRNGDNKDLSALSYLSATASSVVIDVLASTANARVIDALTDDLVEHAQAIRLQNRATHDRIGLYHPDFAPLIDYPILFLAAYLSHNSIGLDGDNVDRGRTIKGMVERLSSIRMGMAWTGLTEDESPVDGILTSNIALLCKRLELTRGSQDVSGWGERDDARLQLCTTPELAPQSILHLIKALTSLPPEEQNVALRQLHVGISLHSPSWQEYLLELFSSEILPSFVDNNESHKDLLELCAHLWLWRDVLDKELISQVESVLFAMPGDELFAPRSLQAQGRVLVLVSHWDAEPGRVGEWLIGIGQAEDLDKNQKRDVCREFIFDDVCRPKLRSTLEALLRDENLATCWEFRWLRHLVEDRR